MTSKSVLRDSYDVLLVEDNPDDAALVELRLRSSGPGVFFALRRVESLDQALGVLWTEPPDVVLLDLALPDSFGLQTLEMMRVAAPTTAIVVLTSKDSDDLGVKALGLGAQEYLHKGATGGALARAIRHAVTRQRRPTPDAGGPIWNSARATHDAVTSLPNRFLFLDRLQHAMAVARRYRETLGLLTLRVSSAIEGVIEPSPELADGIAVEVSRRLQACTRRSDTVARIEDDVYGIVMERARDRDAVHAHVADMCRRLEASIIWTSHRVLIRVASGVAFFPSDSADPSGLLDAALCTQGVLVHA